MPIKVSSFGEALTDIAGTVIGGIVPIGGGVIAQGIDRLFEERENGGAATPVGRFAESMLAPVKSDIWARYTETKKQAAAQKQAVPESGLPSVSSVTESVKTAAVTGINLIIRYWWVIAIGLALYSLFFRKKKVKVRRRRSNPHSNPGTKKRTYVRRKKTQSEIRAERLRNLAKARRARARKRSS